MLHGFNFLKLVFLSTLVLRIQIPVILTLFNTRDLLWQFPSKEEEEHTFRTTPQEHWWIWSECPRHAQVNN